ncbi:unnamed protein product [Cuscuta europaea]|uniref:Uncharacterized protein n=1 Tax=Cuscuta europaea TaxID=41803 RepID=A0A9P0YH34_CUSEU|nr:unnamed protein product [Cuscuta europaea]
MIFGGFAAAELDGEPAAVAELDREPAAAAELDGEPAAAAELDGEPAAAAELDGEPAAAAEFDGEPAAAAMDEISKLAGLCAKSAVSSLAGWEDRALGCRALLACGSRKENTQQEKNVHFGSEKKMLGKELLATTNRKKKIIACYYVE